LARRTKQKCPHAVKADGRSLTGDENGVEKKTVLTADVPPMVQLKKGVRVKENRKNGGKKKKGDPGEQGK